MVWGSLGSAELIVLATLAALSAGTIYWFVRNRIERNGYPLPPGPTPLPFLGSALSIDVREPFKTFTKLRAKYGDIMYIQLLDMDVVVLNSPTVAVELLEKRSQIYSDRPYLATINAYGHNCNFVSARYGEHWRMCRRIFHETFRADAAVAFLPIQCRKAHEMIVSLLDDPNGYVSHYSTFSAAIAMRSAYGYDPSPRNDPMVSTMDDFLRVSVPPIISEKTVLLKAFPFLSNMPDWLPGSWITHEARLARDLGAIALEAPYKYVQNCMESEEIINPSMVSDHITRMEKFDDSHRLLYTRALKHASSTAFMASVETTSSTLITFTFAMVKNPRVWKRAQTEIDAVVGVDRLPEFDDRPSLPYVDAIVRETLRWQPPLPFGVPHATTTSDIYNGFYIPKGATIVGNIWGMTRDGARYPNAEQFIPERFLDPYGMLTNDIPDFVFGFGRRICPGRYTARTSLWIAVATMLATFEFNAAKDGDGNEITFEAQWMNGTARHLLTFPCNLTPRSHVSKAFLERVLAE